MILLEAEGTQEISSPLAEGEAVSFEDGFTGTVVGSEYESYKGQLIHIQTIKLNTGEWRSVFNLSKVQ